MSAIIRASLITSKLIRNNGRLVQHVKFSIGKSTGRKTGSKGRCIIYYIITYKIIDIIVDV